MSDGPEFALLCGLCPTRRVLAELIPRPGRPAVVPVTAGRRRLRPSVGGGEPHMYRIVYAETDDVLRRRCKRGHAWNIPFTKLRQACAAAAAVGRRDIVAGIDVG